MRLQKFTHSCLLVEDGDARVLVDPGMFSHGFEHLEGLTAVLVTHKHPDHLDVERLGGVLDRNPQARLIADRDSAEQLRADHGIEASVASAGTSYDVGTSIEALGELHAEIHPDIPRIANVGYLVGGRLFHPGDSLARPGREVEILALPTMAPWMRMADAIEFLRDVAPATAVPIHEGLLRSTDIFYGHFRLLGPEGTTLTVADDGEPVEL